MTSCHFLLLSSVIIPYFVSMELHVWEGSEGDGIDREQGAEPETRMGPAISHSSLVCTTGTTTYLCVGCIMGSSVIHSSISELLLLMQTVAISFELGKMAAMEIPVSCLVPLASSKTGISSDAPARKFV